MTTDHNPRLFGRHKGRPLGARRARLMDELLPKLEIKIEDGKFHGPPVRDAWLEIGFGGGEHLASQAAAHPDIPMIGCEPFVNGVASLLTHIEAQELKNVRVFPNDARLLLDALPDAGLSRVFVLFADPWPKKRHAERRFIGPENLDRFARVMAHGADLWLATDDPTLCTWMREKANAHPAFDCLYDSGLPPPEWISTRYEHKGRAAGRTPVYMIFRRK